ncbi:MAG: hypothetical protein M3371_10335 [Acidobacteriota bacterium]|nr:hypothetical protein [Acidobacteriota bacterium]
MFPNKWCVACLLALSLIAPAATAQESPASISDSPHAAKSGRTEAAELERRALSLLDEALEEARALKLVENRVRLRAAAAELLWPRDPERARAAFREAMNDLAAATRGLDADSPQDQNLTYVVSQLRQQMLQQVAPRDPKLALEFIRATRQPPPFEHPGNDYKQPDPELALELSLAQQLAASDPQQALRLAEETLQKGISSQLVQLFTQINAADAEAANKFAASVFKKLKTADFLRDHEATSVAGYLLKATRPATPQETIGVADSKYGRPASAGSLRVDAQVRRELLNTLVKTATSIPDSKIFSGASYNLFSTLRQMMPELPQQQVTPAQLATLQRRIDDFEQRQNPHAKVYREFEKLNQSGTVESMLEAAKQAPPEVRPALYQNVARRAFQEGGIERAREILEAHIENKPQRAQMLKELEQQYLWHAIGQSDGEEARRLISRIKSPEERVSLLLNLANNVANAGKRSLARQLLDEAWQTLGARARNNAQFSAQLQIAQAYGRHDPARAFEIVEALIEQLNELLSAAVTLNGFGHEAFQDDELKLQNGYPWSQLVEQCVQELSELSRTDYERARAAADKFQRPDARLLARLGVARGILLASPTHEGGEGSNTVSLPLLRRLILHTHFARNTRK